MHLRTSDQEKLMLGIGNYSCNWGTHICGFYENEQERDEIIYGFLREGLTAGDLQLYCPEEQSKDEFLNSFSVFCPDCQSKLSNEDHISLATAQDLYYPSGEFDPQHMDNALNNFYNNSQKNGQRNIRATAEMVWALKTIPGIEHLMTYESKLNLFIPGKPWVSICMYNLTKFDGSTIMQVLRTHPYTISNGVITKNPYYIEPDEWLKKYAPEYQEPSN